MTPTTDWVSIFELISNLGIGGLMFFLLKTVYKNREDERERTAKERQADQDVHNELQKKFTETVERLIKEQAVAVAKVQAEKDEMAKNNTEMLIGLVPKLECLEELERKRGSRGDVKDV